MKTCSKFKATLKEVLDMYTLDEELRLVKNRRNKKNVEKDCKKNTNKSAQKSANFDFFIDAKQKNGRRTKSQISNLEFNHQFDNKRYSDSLMYKMAPKNKFKEKRHSISHLFTEGTVEYQKYKQKQYH
eukprot:gene2134-2000_t